MEKFVGWSPLQFAHVAGVSLILVQFFVACAPAQLTHTAFLLQLAEVWLYASPETCWFWSFVFFPVYFYVLDASGTFNLFFGAFFRDVPSTNVSR